MVRAWEFMEAIPVNPSHKLHDNLIDLDLTATVSDFEQYLDNRSDNYSIPSDQVFSDNQIKSALHHAQYLISRLDNEFPSNRTLTKLCNQMISYLNGDYLDWH
jgi:hypothetical protein